MGDLAASARKSIQTAMELAETSALQLSEDRVHIQIVTDEASLVKPLQAMNDSSGKVT